MSHLDLGHAGLSPQLPDSCSKSLGDGAGHNPIVCCRLWPTLSAGADTSKEEAPAVMSEDSRSHFLIAPALFLFQLYITSTLVAAAYYNWQFARTKGFVRWLFLGELLSTAKGLIWPYFAFLAPKVSRGPTATVSFGTARMMDSLLRIGYYFLTLAVPFFLGYVILLHFLGWISHRSRPVGALCGFLMAAFSSCSAGFLFYMCLSTAFGEVPSETVIFPAITWTAIALAFYWLATKTPASSKVIAVPYFILAGMTACTAFAIPRNSIAALLLLSVGWLICRQKAPTIADTETYYVCDPSTGEYRPRSSIQIP